MDVMEVKRSYSKTITFLLIKRKKEIFTAKLLTLIELVLFTENIMRPNYEN